ncbi:trans-1,2-dihydrobenzene-1,2-diol dehydrogenase-like isoform X1 [Asterias rubens]|uniref:trans-1,2-dihydrobenzene-1,2-diol dehydrogenase-like isoform X1 n=1 Tax=Asterias rubens TaxID=7604 RepID=UPI001455CB87|nr:trans-1,2-dihydrobenzene-1,2-diol dehydrogenase-like isoform X1 [Asterias rubens]
MKLRWGICSAGNISNNFVSALSSLPSEDHEVVAIAARSKEKANKFAEKHQIAVAYEGYEALARDTNVDIVYIGSINQTHLPLCQLFLNHGKNVLCEKPLGLNKREVQEIIDLAKEKDVFFMEGLWTRFFPAIVKLQELLAANHIGQIKMVSGTFGLPMVQERVHLKEYGGGGLLDIGVYLYQMTLLVFGTPPLSSSTKGFLTDSGVDETTVTTMLFPNKAMASLTCSISQFLDNDMEIRGTQGCIKIKNPFWCPTQLEVTTKKGTTNVLDFPLPKTKATFLFENIVGFQYEAEAVRQCLIKGLKECHVVSHDESLLVAELLQNARHDVGYLLEADMQKGPMTCQ